MTTFLIRFRKRGYLMAYKVLITTATGWSDGWMSYAGLMLALKSHNPEVGNIAFEDHVDENE